MCTILLAIQPNNLEHIRYWPKADVRLRTAMSAFGDKAAMPFWIPCHRNQRRGEMGISVALTRG